MNKGRKETLTTRIISTTFMVVALAVFKPFGLDAWHWQAYVHLLTMGHAGNGFPREKLIKILKFRKFSTFLELRSYRSYRYAQELSHYLYLGVSHQPEYRLNYLTTDYLTTSESRVKI